MQAPGPEVRDAACGDGAQVDAHAAAGRSFRREGRVRATLDTKNHTQNKAIPIDRKSHQESSFCRFCCVWFTMSFTCTNGCASHQDLREATAIPETVQRSHSTGNCLAMMAWCPLQRPHPVCGTSSSHLCQRMLCLCSVLHCFRHTTEMLLIIPDVKSISPTILSASIHTDMFRLIFRCFIHLGMPPVVTGSPWLVARCGPLGRCLPRGARQPCGRLPGFRRVVAQNNTAIMDGRPGHSRTRSV